MAYASPLSDEELFLVVAALGMLRFSPMPANRRVAYEDLSARMGHALLRKMPEAYAALVKNGDIDSLPARDPGPARVVRPIRRGRVWVEG